MVQLPGAGQYRACEAAGVERISLYSATRHSGATQAFNRGEHYGDVSFILGHSSPTTTLRYVDVIAQRKRGVLGTDSKAGYPSVIQDGRGNK